MSPQPKPIPARPQSDRTTPARDVSPRVLRYLTQHPGVSIFRADIAADLQLNEVQVRQAISNLKSKDVLGAREAIETVAAGQVWRWHPNKATGTLEEPAAAPAATERIAREIGRTREGDSIWQADDGTLWRATEL